MTEQTKGFTELVKSPVADAVALLTHYSFDLRSQTAVELVDAWLTDYSPAWIHLAVVEALYQGRYKAISVEQILALWQRRGQPLQHFNHEFERLVCHKLPRSLTTLPGIDPDSEAQNEAIAALLRNLHHDITTQPTHEDSDGTETTISEEKTTTSSPRESTAAQMPSEMSAAATPPEATPVSNSPQLPVLPSSLAPGANGTPLPQNSQTEARDRSGMAESTIVASPEGESVDATVTHPTRSGEETTAPVPTREISAETPPLPQNPPFQTNSYPGLAELVESARQEILDGRPSDATPDSGEVVPAHPVDDSQINSSADSFPPLDSGFGLQPTIDDPDLLKSTANHDPINQFTPVPESSEFYTKLRAVAHVDEQGTPL